MSAMSRREPSSYPWQLLLFFAAWFAVSGVDALSLCGLAGTSRPETNSLSSKSAQFQSLSQGYTHVKASTFVVSPLLLLKGNWQDQVTSSLACHNTLPVRRSFLVMGKGDGKNKRKKKASSSAKSASMTTTPQHQPPPQRVSTDINVPVRMQIRYGQMRKEMDKQASTSFRQKKVERTKYRRTWGVYCKKSIL